MEWFEPIKTWLTDNAAWLGSLAAVVGICGGAFAIVKLLPRLRQQKSKGPAAIEANPQNNFTNAPVVNVTQHVSTPADAKHSVLIEKIYDDLREAQALNDEHAANAQNLQSELQTSQDENKALKNAISDLIDEEVPQAAEAVEHLRRGDTEQAKSLFRELAEAKTSVGATAYKEAA